MFPRLGPVDVPSVLLASEGTSVAPEGVNVVAVAVGNFAGLDGSMVVVIRLETTVSVAPLDRPLKSFVPFVIKQKYLALSSEEILQITKV